MKTQRIRSQAGRVLQILLVVILTLAMAVLHYRAGPLRELLWLSTALIIGFVLDRWWMLLVAAIPWALAAATAWLAGSQIALQNWDILMSASEVVGSIGTGLFGIGLGILLRRYHRMPSPHERGPHR